MSSVRYNEAEVLVTLDFIAKSLMFEASVKKSGIHGRIVGVPHRAENQLLRGESPNPT